MKTKGLNAILKMSWIFEEGLRSVNEAERVRAESPAEVESTGLGGPAEPKQKSSRYLFTPIILRSKNLERQTARNFGWGKKIVN